MHYSNGREAKAGDMVVGKNCSGDPTSGVIYDLKAASQCHPGGGCNARVVPISQNQYCNVGDLLHVDDVKPAAAALRGLQDRSAPTPPPPSGPTA